MSQDTDNLLNKVADGVVPLPRFNRRKDGFSRNDVVEAFQSAFLMVGGIQRLALWGNDNPTEFYRLYAKLLPSTTVVLGDAGALEIIHALAPTALDRHDAPRDLSQRPEDLPYTEFTDKPKESVQRGEDS